MDLAFIARRLDAYERLVRLDKPIGTLLLLWPTLWAVWLAARGGPAPGAALLFFVRAAPSGRAGGGGRRRREGGRRGNACDSRGPGNRDRSAMAVLRGPGRSGGVGRAALVADSR